MKPYCIFTFQDEAGNQAGNLCLEVDGPDHAKVLALALSNTTGCSVYGTVTEYVKTSVGAAVPEMPLPEDSDTTETAPFRTI